jgi:hypothetical protein
MREKNAEENGIYNPTEWPQKLGDSEEILPY